ncbi:Metal-dependent phosphohydrolase HD region [uncultured delta proteobacterium]|uniref:Metal-dependent phosphohydrolase HD region n=1 Tax=uncultured delta proteobacterium TaxID=34034 RepID=A0A212IUP3_9DELT|nr:Metal-dependent phosphohydrolase HD region [uncultured delta proteobacterium]
MSYGTVLIRFAFRAPRRMMPAMNACAAPKHDIPDMEPHFRAFSEYARSFYSGEADHDFHLDLKAEHSRNVFAHARGIADGEEFFLADHGRRSALLLAALYHDLGRFRQYDAYGTFSDAQSVNHAHLSVREMKRLRLLDGEDERVRGLALAGIVLHNRFAVPRSMDADALAVAKAVRDADKLDILRVMAAHLTGEGPVDPVVALGTVASPRVSPAVLAAFSERRLGFYGDMATTTDFKLLVCGWLYDLNYAFSRKTAAGEGYLAAILESLPDTDELAPHVAAYRKDLAAHAA